MRDGITPGGHAIGWTFDMGPGLGTADSACVRATPPSCPDVKIKSPRVVRTDVRARRVRVKPDLQVVHLWVGM